LLVPPGELPTIKALTYSSQKWQWVADRAAAVWGDGAAVVRASVGRIGEARLLQVDDATMLARTVAEARTLPGWEHAELVTGHVRRWGGALPQYLVGHRGLVQRLRGAVADLTGIEVCGAALDGVGIAATIGTATTAARTVLCGSDQTQSVPAGSSARPAQHFDHEERSAR
jgi:oxygen-dependent protoporphyrinogen oxidase